MFSYSDHRLPRLSLSWLFHNRSRSSQIDSAEQPVSCSSKADSSAPPNRFAIIVVGMLGWAILTGFAANLNAQLVKEDASDYLPASTAIYLHVDRPANLIQEIENHRVVQRASELPQVQQIIASPQFAMAMVGKAMLESQLGQPVLETLKENTQLGLWLAVDPNTNGVIIIFRSQSEDRLKKAAGKIMRFASNAAKQQGNEFNFKRQEYRGAVTAELGKALVARYQDWFIICNKPKLAKAFVDNLIDGSSTSLADEPWFRDAVSNRDAHDVWATANLAVVRSAMIQPVFSGRTDHPGVELLFGGVLDLLQHAPSVTAQLDLTDDLVFNIAAPFDLKWKNESRDFFYGPKSIGRAPKMLQPHNTIASLTSYRDVGLWWMSKEELYAENVIAQLAQTDSQLSTIFSGMDFGQDVLGSLQPGVQIIVTENKYQIDHTPDVKIPAFALVGKLKNPDKLRRKLKIAFQSVIGFANINLGMNGQPQLDVETESIGDTKLTSASYFVEEGTEEGLVLFNFAPTIAFQGSDLILSSNRELAVELAELLKQRTGSPTEDQNTRIRIDGPMLHQILKQNSESLIAHNMLEEGNDRQQAENEIGILLTIIEFFRDANVDYQIKSDSMNIQAKIRLKN